jgi:hypothetical protein
MSGGHAARVKAVKEAFDPTVLGQICMAPESYFEKYGEEYKADSGKGKFAFYFQDNKANILAIAHMDSVQDKKDFGFAKYFSGKEMVLSPTLDDRLGVYVICELLPKLGIKTDILLTTDEERGSSTAKLFVTDKKYRWMFQFDRAGTDVVMYQYRTDEAFKKLEEVGFKTGMGSASDISKLDDLGCLGFNFGVGYEDYHSARAYVWLDDLFDQVARFVKFHKLYSREHMVYDKTKSHTSHVTTNYHGYVPSNYMGGGSIWTPAGGGGAYGDFESDHGRRINGVWHTKLEWNDNVKLYVVNHALYRLKPDTRPVEDFAILEKNERWSNKDQKFAYLGEYSKEEIIAIARAKPDQTEVLEAGDPKESPQLSLTERSSVPSTVGSLDDPCLCGHSRFVHHRIIHLHKNQRVLDACDFWKCNCKGFLEYHPKFKSEGI